MTASAKAVRRARGLTITGQVLAPGTLPGRTVDRLAVDERRRLALVALGGLILKVQRGDATAEPAASDPGRIGGA